MAIGLDGDWQEDQYEVKNGRSMRIKVTKLLYSKKSKYQHIDVYDTQSFGRMLVLDGIVQLTEKDESGYQEMIAHVPLNAHPNPKTLAIIGGGDGGVVREALKHPSIEHIDLCDLDSEVTAVSKEFFPNISKDLDNPKVSLFNQDGAKFLSEKKNAYDVIIVDSSDPVGPADSLFMKPFFETCKEALKEGGILVTQAESIFYDFPLVQRIVGDLKQTFSYVKYFYTMVPSYPSGMIGFSFSSKGPDTSLKRPEGLTSLKPLAYYSKEMHSASFVLPKFARKILE